jgi:hypothetical protein
MGGRLVALGGCTSGGLEAPPSGHYRLGDVLSSEWTKLTTVRSTVWTLVITAVAGMGIGALVT